MDGSVKVLVITLEGDIKYNFGDKRTVPEVLKEIEECEGEFFQVIDACAIKKSEIISVESVDIKPKGGE